MTTCVQLLSCAEGEHGYACPAVECDCGGWVEANGAEYHEPTCCIFIAHDKESE